MKIFWWSSELDEKVMSDMVRFFITCKTENEDAIVVICSPGGKLDCLNAVISTIRDSKVHLTTIGMGTVASAAAAIFAMGDERILLPDTNLLLHHGGISYRGPISLKVEGLEKKAKNLREADNKFVSLYFEKTKLTMKDFSKKCKNDQDWILTPSEIEKYEFTTRSYEGWTDLIAGAMKSSEEKK